MGSYCSVGIQLPSCKMKTVQRSTVQQLHMLILYCTLKSLLRDYISCYVFFSTIFKRIIEQKASLCFSFYFIFLIFVPKNELGFLKFRISLKISKVLCQFAHLISHFKLYRIILKIASYISQSFSAKHLQLFKGNYSQCLQIFKNSSKD